MFNTFHEDTHYFAVTLNNFSTLYDHISFPGEMANVNEHKYQVWCGVQEYKTYRDRKFIVTMVYFWSGNDDFIVTLHVWVKTHGACDGHVFVLSKCWRKWHSTKLFYLKNRAFWNMSIKLHILATSINTRFDFVISVIFEQKHRLLYYC